jgi:hypothetical protein
MTEYHKIAVKMPKQIYQKIRTRAEKERVSFSVMATKMLECGLFDYEESEQYDEREQDVRV